MLKRKDDRSLRIEGDDGGAYLFDRYDLEVEEDEDGGLSVEVSNDGDGSWTMISPEDALELGYWLVAWASKCLNK